MQLKMSLLSISLTLVVACAKTTEPQAAACVDEHAASSACGAAVTGSALTAEPSTRVDASGATVQHAGAPFAGAAEVALADLLAKADDYKGRTVRIGGQVAAMCHHKRGWFAVVSGEPQSPHLRVLTAPAFLVPEGAIGKRAFAEGVVDTVEVSAQAAQHFATEHRLGEPPAAGAPLKQVVLRASGAEFM